uniref:CD97 molecule n=1 Tax=Nothobranchius kuhntae TaxID=321403 RepID=A0A1A8JPP3_NOTKU
MKSWGGKDEHGSSEGGRFSGCLDLFYLFTMADKWTLLKLAFVLLLLTVQTKGCNDGFNKQNNECIDDDECADNGLCGDNAKCFNTIGSYYCQCAEGFKSSRNENFKADSPEKCKDIDECLTASICGPNASCKNTISSYICFCNEGFVSSTRMETFHPGNNASCNDINECEEGSVCGPNSSCVNTHGSSYCKCNVGFGLRSGKLNYTGKVEQCEDICKIDETICRNGTCSVEAGGHFCACHAGFTNYGRRRSPCVELDCDVFKVEDILGEKHNIVQDHVKQLKEGCVDLSESEDPKELDGEHLLKVLQSIIDKLLSSEVLRDNRKVSTFLALVEEALRLSGPFVATPGTKMSSSHTELELVVYNGSIIPQGRKKLSTKHAQLEVDMEVAAGDPSHHPGFTTVSLLTYSNLEKSADDFFTGMKPHENQSFKINSKVVTVTVSNRDTNLLKEPVKITMYHLEQSNGFLHTCVFWDSSEDGGTWSSRGCSTEESNSEYTTCSCDHLSSFAVLMALYEIEAPFELQLVTWVGLSLSLICLFICILTFSMIRSIQSPRTTIHLHLCISLFIANAIFLAGISKTENRVGCAVVAGLLHFFYLSAFCWMCLEGVQLFRMVVLVFNTHFKTIYMMAGGYGVPAVVVAISASVNSKGYGTNRYCWLNLSSIWSFFGPACVIIFVNILFFLITAWKLAQKFTSLNPDLNNLQKIKAFIVTAVAQLCVLGIMWIFGCFQFETNSITISYLFTIFGSLQGFMLFVMHCLFSKQVRDEYANILCGLSAPRKRKYSEFSFSHSSKANASKSTQDTGESHI